MGSPSNKLAIVPLMVYMVGVIVNSVGPAAATDPKRESASSGVWQGCHADADHYNGLPDLLDRFAIGELRVAPGFAGTGNPGAERLLESAGARGIPVRPIAEGRSWRLGGATLSALHPPEGWHSEFTDITPASCDLEGIIRLLLTGGPEAVGWHSKGDERDCVFPRPNIGAPGLRPGPPACYAGPAELLDLAGARRA
jgi:hypothetical protein